MDMPCQKDLRKLYMRLSGLESDMKPKTLGKLRHVTELHPDATQTGAVAAAKDAGKSSGNAQQ